MGVIACRNETCGNLRSTTVRSPEGEEIPRCRVCGDPPYAWTDDEKAIEKDQDPMLLLELLMGTRKLTVFDGNFYWYDSYFEEQSLVEEELTELKQILKEIVDG